MEPVTVFSQPSHAMSRCSNAKSDFFSFVIVSALVVPKTLDSRLSWRSTSDSVSELIQSGFTVVSALVLTAAEESRRAAGARVVVRAASTSGGMVRWDASLAW